MDMVKRPIAINLSDGESVDFNPPDDLWLDMLAYCELAGLSIGELITVALKEGLPELMRERRGADG